MSSPLLQVENLSVAFTRDGRVTVPVRSVSFDIRAGERVALVGESGCGKSLTALSLARLPPTDSARVSGRVLFDGADLLALPASAIRRVRGSGMAYVFQDPTASLNPVMRVGDQIAECLRHLPRRARAERAETLFARVGLPDPARAVRAFPCEMSGGQQQRVMLAMALASHPKLLVADEPTTALDVTTQRQVLDLIDELAAAYQMAVLLITHNLGLVAGRMSRMNVMYAGRVIESGSVEDVLARPRHPYTRGLLAAVPMLDSPQGAVLRDIPGTVPSPDNLPDGCAFAPRCPDARGLCRQSAPPLRREGGRCWECLL
ncbi:MAG: ABC transporter ATP-binding protein [Kiritimatiellaeota bacterium]|nr:ABC transporter ATP-binding protein [Kiritimatiellota bacterium]